MFKSGNHQNSENKVSKATGITFAAFLDTAQKIADSASKSKGLAIYSFLLTVMRIFSLDSSEPQDSKSKGFRGQKFLILPNSILSHSLFIAVTSDQQVL